MGAYVHFGISYADDMAFDPKNFLNVDGSDQWGHITDIGFGGKSLPITIEDMYEVEQKGFNITFREDSDLAERSWNLWFWVTEDEDPNSFKLKAPREPLLMPSLEV